MPAAVSAHAAEATPEPAEPPFGAFGPNLLQRIVRALAAIPPLHRGAFRRPMASLIRSLAPSVCIDVARNGASYRLRPEPNLIEDALLVHGRYNRREIDFLRDGTPDGGTFVDLGANVGLYALPLARKAGPAGRVLAIDANPRMATALRFNAAASGLANVTIACIAVGEADRRVRLEIQKDDLAIVETRADPLGDIEMKPLADIVAVCGITRIDTLKADIEGYEDRALVPFLSTCDDALKPARIVLEHLNEREWPMDLYGCLADQGYRLVRRERSNTLYARDITSETGNG